MTHAAQCPARHVLVTAPLPPAELVFWVDLDQPNTLEQLAGTLHACLSLAEANASGQALPESEELCYASAQAAYAQFSLNWREAPTSEKERFMRELAQKARPHLTLRKAAELMLRFGKKPSDAKGAAHA